MKGYLLLTLSVFLLLLLLPCLFCRPSADKQQTAGTSAAVETGAANTAAPVSFSVQHSDGSGVSAMSARDLVLYATIAELPSDSQEEALKAQAVACYTYFCYQQQVADGALDISGVTASFPEAFCEDYWRAKWGDAYESAMSRYATAVDEVIGQRMVYDGAPILAVWHALNAGQTEAAADIWQEEVPYLQSVSSPADMLSPDVASCVTMTAAEVSEALLRAEETLSLPEDYTVWFADCERTAAGTVKSVRFGEQTLSGQQVRAALSLRSACFEVSAEQGELIFSVRGYGHFVGMSQYGANALAEDGCTWQEILAHYYPHTTIE